MCFVEKLNVAQRATPLVEVLNPHRRRRLWRRYPEDTYILALAFVAFGWTFVDVAVEDIR